MHTDLPPNKDVNPESLKLGHEPDVVDARTILYVPIAIVITFAITFGVVSWIISNTRITDEPRPGNPLAAERFRKPVDQPMLNKRLGTMSSTDPAATVKAPRLEGLTQMTTENVPYLQSSPPTKEGNSPQYYPEAMRPDSSHSKDLGLQDYAWKEKKDSTVRVPIADVMKLLVAGADGKDKEAEAIYKKTLKYDPVSKAVPLDRETVKIPAKGDAPKAEPKKGAVH